VVLRTVPNVWQAAQYQTTTAADCALQNYSITILTKLPWLLHYCMIMHNNDDDAGGGGDKNNQIRHSYL
jgi:hypothetical protein